MIKFKAKTWNMIFDTSFLMMLLFFPALKGYIYKVITIFIPKLYGKPNGEEIFSAIVWGALVLSTMGIWLKRLKYKHIVLFGAMFLFSFIMYVKEKDNPNSAFTVERFSSLYLSLMPALFYGACMKFNQNIKRYLLYGAVFTLLVNVVYLFYKNTQIEMKDDNMEFAYRILPSVLIIIGSVVEKKIPISTILLRLALSFAGVIFLLMQGTRGPLLCVAACVVLLGFKTFSIKKTVMILLSLSAVVCFIIFTSLGNSLLLWMIDLFDSIGVSVRFLERLVNGEIIESTGRDVIADFLLADLKTAPYKVRGLFADIAATKGLVGNKGYVIYVDGTYAHNIYIEIIYQFGVLIGSILFVSICIGIINNYLFSKNHYGYLISLLITIGFVHLLISSSYLRSTYFFVLVGTFFNKNICKKPKPPMTSIENPLDLEKIDGKRVLLPFKLNAIISSIKGENK